MDSVVDKSDMVYCSKSGNWVGKYYCNVLCEVKCRTTRTLDPEIAVFMYELNKRL